MKNQNRWKRFSFSDDLDERPAPKPTLAYLAAVLESVVGKERQQEFSKSLDWTAPSFALVEQYEAKIKAEKQLLIDNQTPAEVDAWNDGAATERDNLAVLVCIGRGGNVQEFYQGVINDLTDELRHETDADEIAEITHLIGFYQSRLDKSRNDFDIDEREIRATHESARPTL